MTFKKLGNRKVLEFEVDENNCFNVTSHRKERDGYVRLMINRKHVPVHRFIYTEMFGPIPDGLIVRHKCDNPSCSNPEHLELGTQMDNMHDKIKRNRQTRGSHCKSSKLTDEKAREIKFGHPGKTQTELAAMYGVSQALISGIQLNKTWKHIKEPEEVLEP